MDNLITFYNFLDECWQRHCIRLSVWGVKCHSDNGVWDHVFALVTGCHTLFSGFSLALGRDERRLQRGEKYMNQFLGCPGAQEKMTWNNSSSCFFRSINSQLGCGRRQMIRKERRAIKCSHFYKRRSFLEEKVKKKERTSGEEGRKGAFLQEGRGQ